MLALCLTVATTASVATSLPPELSPPKKLELFGNEAWYKNQKGKEQAFVGILKKHNRKGVVGFGRMNPYYLVMGEKNVRDVYVGAQRNALGPYVGRKVKLIGKAVDLRLEGTTSREIWPARLVLLAEGKKNADPNKLTIYKQTRWPFESANPNGPRKGKQLAIRSQAELAKLVGKNKVNDVAKLLRVRSFDWKKTMLIVVTAGVRPTSGFRVTVNSIAKSPKGIEVQWSVLPPGAFAGQAFTHPGQVALVERADGKITFKQNRNIKVLPPSANR